jgi:hypothetical protein
MAPIMARKSGRSRFRIESWWESDDGAEMVGKRAGDRDAQIRGP